MLKYMYLVVASVLAISCNGLAYKGTPLHNAAADGDFEKVRSLVESGSSPKMFDENGERATWLAIARGHHEIAKYLIDQGGDLDYKNYSGEYRGNEYNYPKKEGDQ